MTEQRAEPAIPLLRRPRQEDLSLSFEVSLGYLSRPHFDKEKLLEKERKEIWPFLYVET